MTYQPRLPPRDYQIAANKKMYGRPAFALLMAMRTGKTKVALDDFGALEINKEVDDLLVIAPAGVYRTWETAIKEHLSEDLLRRVDVYTWTSGKFTGLVRFMNTLDRPRIMLMNVEALSRKGEARSTAINFTRQRRCVVAIDESTIIKNPSAKRTKFINENIAPLARYRRILSGLATPRSPLDLYSQFEFLDTKILGYDSYWVWRRRYAILQRTEIGGRYVDLVVGYQNVEELKEIIEPYSYRVEFRPKIPSTYSIREISLTEEQDKAYKELKEFATTQLGDGSHVTATVVIAQILRLHQILCGHVVDELGNHHEIPETRTDELLELLDEYQGKAVIWCSYDKDIRKVSKALGDYFGCPVARFWGGNVLEREQEELNFKTLPDWRFMVATPDAGGRGRTWDCADLVVYYSSRNNLEHRDQSEQRVQGVNKDRQVDYIDLIAPNTVEMKILEALRNKINMAAIINGDNFREWLI